MAVLNVEVVIHSHLIFPSGIFFSFKTYHPLMLQGYRLFIEALLVSKNCQNFLHAGTWRHSNHPKVDCLRTLPYSFGNHWNTMKAICPVLTPRFSSIALDDDNARSMVLYCSLGSPGMRLCAWHNNILGFFKVLICRLCLLLHTPQHPKQTKKHHISKTMAFY